MTDIAVLGFSVDTRQLDGAKAALAALGVAAKGAELAAEGAGAAMGGAFRVIETTADRMNRAVVSAFKALGYAVTEPQQAFARLGQSAEDTKRKLENISGTINVMQLAFYAATGRIKDFAIEGGIALSDMEKRSSKLAESMTLLQKGLALAGVGVGISQLMKYTDEYGRMGAQLSQVAKSTRDFEDTQRALYKQAQQTGQSVADSAKLYSTMARATQELNVSSTQLLDVTGMVNKMLMTAQLPAESASAALFQFSQGMAAGTLRGEELNSVMEQMPPLARAIADGMGITVGQLRAVAAEGTLTSKAVLAALLSQKDAIEAQFAAMMGGATTMSNLTSRADNAMMMLIGRADELGGATLALQGAFAAVVSFLESDDTATTMAVAFEKLGQAIQIVVGVFAALLPYLDEVLGLWIAGKGVLALAAFGFSILSTVKTVGFLSTALTTVATAMGATATQVAQLSAQMAVLGRMATLATVVSGILSAVTAIGMLVAGFFLFSDTTTTAQKAANDYNGVLDKLGGTAEDVAKKFQALSAEQQKLTVQQTQIAVNTNLEELKKQEAALRDRIGAAIESKYSSTSDDTLGLNILELQRFNEIMANGGKGMADYVEHLKKVGAVSESQYQALVKQNAGMESQREAVAKLEAQLRIVTNSRRGDEEAILGQNAALTAERDNLAKNTEEWAKYIAKIRESAATQSMSPTELAANKGQQLNQSPITVAAGVGLATLTEGYKDLQAAIKSTDASEAERLRTVIAATEASHLQAVRVEAVAAATQAANAAGMDSWQVQAQAAAAGEKAMEAEKKRLDVAGAVGRIQREAADEATKATNQQIRGLEESSKYTQIQTDLTRGLAVEWAGVGDAQAIMQSYMQQNGMQQADAVKAMVDAIKVYDSTLAKTGDSTLALSQAQAVLTEAQGKYALKVAETGVAEQRVTEEMARQNELMQLKNAAVEALNSKGSVSLTYDLGGSGNIYDMVAQNLPQIEEYYRRVAAMDAEVRKLIAQGLPFDAQTNKVKEMLKGFDNESVAAIQKITNGLITERQELEKNAPSWAELTGTVEENNAAKETAAKLSAILPTLLSKESEAREKEAMTAAEAKDAAVAYQKARSEVAKAYQASLTPQEKYLAKLKEIAQWEKEMRDHGDDKKGEEWEKAARGLAKAREEAEGLKAAADPMAKIFDEAAKSIYGAWTGMFESLFTGSLQSFSDFVESIKTMFLKMLAQMAAQALAKPILLPMMQTMGVGGATIDSLFGAGTSVAAGSSGGGIGGLASNLSSGFGLFGPGGLGSSVGGMVGGLGTLFGSSGMAAGGAMMSNLGLIPGITQAFSAGMTSITAGATSIGAGMIASAAIPIVAALVAIAAIMGAFSGPTPHPSSLAVAGGYVDPKWGAGYLGKGGGGVYGESGMEFGYSYGHTDPKDAMKLRDGLMEIDKALVALIPNADLAGVQLGVFGQTAEGFVAGFRDHVVSGVEEMTALFVKDWVNAATAMGAVDKTINAVLQNIEGSAEDVMKALGGLLQIDAYIAADPKQDVEDATANANQTPSQAIAKMRAELETLAGTFDGTAASAIALGAASQSLYQAELQMIQAIQSAVTGIAQSFGASIEEIKLSVMDTGQKYEYFTSQAEAAFAAMQTATDPSEIAKQAEIARNASMQAYNLLTDEQKAAESTAFTQFLTDAQQLATDKLNAAQQAVIEQHKATADVLAAALEQAGVTAATALEQAGTSMAAAVGSAAEQVAAALRVPVKVEVDLNSGGAGGMAAGGIVPGSWNGKPGIEGDSVLTALTPGEAVIPRDMTLKHADLIKKIMADRVGYAAYGELPPYVDPGGDGTNPGDPAGGWTPDPGFGGNVGDYIDDWQPNPQYPPTPNINNVDENGQVDDKVKQLADMMKEIEKALRDMGLTEWQKQLEAIQDTLKDNIEKATELGASEDQLAKIRELAEKQTAAAIEERAGQLADFMDGINKSVADLDMSAFEQQLRDIQDQMTANIKQAQELGASEADLAAIRDLAEKQTAAATAERASQLADFMAGINSAATDMDVSDYEKSLQAIRDQMDANIKQATELGASEEALGTIRDASLKQYEAAVAERARQLGEFMAGISRTASDMDLSDFERELLSIQDQMAESVKQATDLGASEADLAAIRDLAEKQTAAATAERARQLNEFMDGISKSAADIGLSDFERQLAGIADQMEANIKQATELGATEAQLAAIRDLAEKQAAAAAAARAQQLADLIAPSQIALDEQGMSDAAKAIAAINRELVALIEQAAELGATDSQIDTLREAAGLRAAEVAHQAFQDATDKSKQALDAIAEKLKSVTEAIKQATRGIDDSILQLRRKNPDFDEAAYQAENEAAMRTALDAALSTDDYAAQIAAVNDLRGAIADRYSAEEAALIKVNESAKRLADIAKQLRDYVASLKVSDLSPLDPGQKLAEARDQYEATLLKAQAGDVDAAAALQGKAQSYLEQARSYYASSADYAAIFDAVTSALTGYADQQSAAVDEAETQTALEEKALALQQDSIDKLEALKLVLRQIETKASADAAAQSLAEQQNLAAEISKLIAALQESDLASTAAVVAAIAALAAAQNAGAAASAGTITRTWDEQVAAGIFAPSADPPSISRYAAGGMTSPGWAMVGEEGPELVNFSQPGRVYTATDTARMMSDNDSSPDTEAVVIELKALVRLQSEANRQLIAKLDKVESRLAGIERTARLEAAA